MDPLTLSARFAAYVWFEECIPGKSGAHEEAMKFAQENWRAFRGSAREGLGRLLIRVGGLKESTTKGKRRPAAGRARSGACDMTLPLVHAE